MQIKCPGCGTSGEVPATMQGKLIECNQCGQRIQIPPPANVQQVIHHKTAVVSTDETPCRYCGELIKSSAIKCKHCHEYLVPGMGQRQTAQQQPAVNHIEVNINPDSKTIIAAEPKKKTSGCAWGCLILIIIVIVLWIIGISASPK